MNSTRFTSQDLKATQPAGSTRQAAGLASRIARGPVPNLLSIVEKEHDRLIQLQIAVQHLQNCGAVYREMVPVQEMFNGQMVGQGETEVFDVNCHPNPKRCQAWSHGKGKHKKCKRFIQVLGIPPGVLTETAVRASMVSDVSRKT